MSKMMIKHFDEFNVIEKQYENAYPDAVKFEGDITGLDQWIKITFENGDVLEHKMKLEDFGVGGSIHTFLLNGEVIKIFDMYKEENSDLYMDLLISNNGDWAETYKQISNL